VVLADFRRRYAYHIECDFGRIITRFIENDTMRYASLRLVRDYNTIYYYDVRKSYANQSLYAGIDTYVIIM